MDEFKPLDLFGSSSENTTEEIINPISQENPEEAPAEEKVESAKATVNVESDDTTVKDETVDTTVVTEESPIIDDTIAEETASETEEKPEVKEETTCENDNKTQEPPEADKLDNILEAQKAISEQIAALEQLFNSRIMHTDHEEKIVDQMHKELQKYKEDMYAQLVRPILMDVIEVRDSIMRIGATYLAKPEGERDIPNKTFSDYAYDLQDILEKNAVELYRSNVGDDFTPIKQRVIKKVPTQDNALHGKVAESLSCGYSYNGKTISAEKITVYVYEAETENKENSEVIENG